jgi:hypothetical protein
MLLLGTVAQAENKRPAKIWSRTGPLGQTPKRITDAYPLSDQRNKDGWVKFEPMSDEFEGKVPRSFPHRRRAPLDRQRVMNLKCRGVLRPTNAKPL